MCILQTECDLNRAMLHFGNVLPKIPVSEDCSCWTIINDQFSDSTYNRHPDAEPDIKMDYKNADLLLFRASKS